MNWMLTSIEQHSALWIVISAGVGGFFGATIKFIFDQIMSPRFASNRAVRDAIKIYAYPLIQSLDSLIKIIEFHFAFIKKGRTEMRNDDYYKMSTLYTFGRFLGWCEIIESTAIFKHEPSTKQARNFSIHFNGVFKGMTSFYYFSELKNVDITAIKAVTVPRLYLKAIGEIMIARNSKPNTVAEQPIGFVEFSDKYRNSIEFSQWFDPLSRYIDKVWEGEGSLAWSRLVIISAKMNVLLHLLDKKSQHTKHRPVRGLNSLPLPVKSLLYNELFKGGWVHLLEDRDVKA